MSERKYLGRPGHFVGADNCRFHLHTHVAGYCVSTVGDYRPPHVWDESMGGLRAREREDPMDEIGHRRFFETMVFLLTESGDDVQDWQEVDFAAYATTAEADAGHEQMVSRVERGEVKR